MDLDRKSEQTQMLFRAINRMRSASASREEISQDLRDAGVDPKDLVERVRPRLNSLLRSGGVDIRAESKRSSAPLINQLRRLTKLAPHDLARRLDVPLAFLSAIERHLDVIPSTWREELAKRMKQTLQISEDMALTLLQADSRLEFANLNQSPANQRITPEYILDMSNMNQTSKQFWLDLARSR